MRTSGLTRIHGDHGGTSLCVLVCGGRDFRDRIELSDTLDGLHEVRRFAQIIAGGAHGADLLAEEWAEVNGVACEVYHADPMRLGRDAGRVRNQRMLVEGRPELVVAFRGGRRTEHMVRLARDAGIEVIETARRRLVTPSALWSRLSSALSATLWTPNRALMAADRSSFTGHPSCGEAGAAAISAEPIPSLPPPDPAAS